MDFSILKSGKVNLILYFLYLMNILGLTSTGEQAPKPFKGAAPVVKDLSGNK